MPVRKEALSFLLVVVGLFTLVFQMRWPRNGADKCVCVCVCVVGGWRRSCLVHAWRGGTEGDPTPKLFSSQTNSRAFFKGKNHFFQADLPVLRSDQTTPRRDLWRLAPS